MFVEKKEDTTKKRVSRRQLFRSIGTLGRDVETEEGKSISGTVRYPWGAVAGATVTAADKSVVSDADGKYRIAGLAPGTYTLVSEAPFPGYEMQPQKVEVSTDELDAVDLFLDFEKTILEGTVYDQDKKPIDAAAVSGVLCGRDVETTTTDQQGHFRFDRASPGHQFVRVNAKGFMGEVRDLEARKDEKTTADFQLQAAPCRLHGTLTDTNGEPLPGEIILRRGDVIVEKTTPDGTGQYEFSLIPGTYGLQARAPGYPQEGWAGKSRRTQKLTSNLAQLPVDQAEYFH